MSKLKAFLRRDWAKFKRQRKTPINWKMHFMLILIGIGLIILGSIFGSAFTKLMKVVYAVMIVALAGRNRIKTKLFSKTQIRKAFSSDGKATKQEIAEMIAQRFPDELAHRLPAKRRAWDKEDPKMDIFDAVALAMTFTAVNCVNRWG